MALPGHIRSMRTGGVLRQAIRLAACVYVPGAEAPGLPSLQTQDFSPGEFGCLAHRPIFIAKTKRGRCKLFSEESPMPIATGTPKHDNGGDLDGSEDAGGDARAPSLGPRSPIGVGDRLRGDDGLGGGDDSSVPGRSGGYFQRNDMGDSSVDMRLPCPYLPRLTS